MPYLMWTSLLLSVASYATWTLPPYWYASLPRVTTTRQEDRAAPSALTARSAAASMTPAERQTTTCCHSAVPQTKNDNQKPHPTRHQPAGGTPPAVHQHRFRPRDHSLLAFQNPA